MIVASPWTCVWLCWRMMKDLKLKDGMLLIGCRNVLSFLGCSWRSSLTPLSWIRWEINLKMSICRSTALTWWRIILFSLFIGECHCDGCCFTDFDSQPWVWDRDVENRIWAWNCVDLVEVILCHSQTIVERVYLIKCFWMFLWQWGLGASH